MPHGFAMLRTLRSFVSLTALSSELRVYGSIPRATTEETIRPGTPFGRAFIDRKTIHVHDLAKEADTEFPDSRPRQQITGSRTVLATPLLREGVGLGVIWIRRTEVRPFTDKQISC